MAQVVSEKMIDRARGRVPSGGTVAMRIFCVLLLSAGILMIYYLWLEVIVRQVLYKRFGDSAMMNQVGPDYEGAYRMVSWQAILCLVISGALAFWLRHKIKLWLSVILLVLAVVASPVMSGLFKKGILVPTSPAAVLPSGPIEPTEAEEEAATDEEADHDHAHPDLSGEDAPETTPDEPATAPQDALPGTGLPSANPESLGPAPADAPPDVAPPAPASPEMRLDDPAPEPSPLPFEPPTPLLDSQPLPGAGVGAGT